jgi:hypothetical protein
MSLIGLLIAVLLACVVIWLVRLLLSAFKVPDPINTVIFVVVVIVILLWFLGGLAPIRPIIIR